MNYSGNSRYVNPALLRQLATKVAKSANAVSTNEANIFASQDGVFENAYMPNMNSSVANTNLFGDAVQHTPQRAFSQSGRSREINIFGAQEVYTGASVQNAYPMPVKKNNNSIFIETGYLTKTPETGSKIDYMDMDVALGLKPAKRTSSETVSKPEAKVSSEEPQKPVVTEDNKEVNIFLNTSNAENATPTEDITSIEAQASSPAVVSQTAENNVVKSSDDELEVELSKDNPFAVE